ncbi:hypothetical protein E1B28_013107 [Marasmius oreades]|uniref:Uncharacterized protein n=1 Tax=Marasmius oreades TaxID=181124 RepID=A0A9P7RPT1_9AGAR|nr:uncharacterized protein E1B28_013107 [Marasmius oreades]KAG7087128.1 hypothetical protein E1B28_013107 [Marasmius oreades]
MKGDVPLTNNCANDGRRKQRNFSLRLCIMRRYGKIYTLVSTCLTSTAFHISPPLPSAVVTGQAVPFNWTRDLSTDPSEFSFQTIHGEGPSFPDSTYPVDKDEAGRENGWFTLTFTRPAYYNVIAIDNSTRAFFQAPVVIVVTHSTASDTNSPGPSITATNDVNSNTSIGNPTPASEPETNRPPTSTAPPQTLSGTSASSRNIKPTVIGSVVGGTVFLLLLLFFIRYRRNKPSRRLIPTPYLDMKPFSGPYMDIRERKIQLLSQREGLERDLEAYEQASQGSNSRTEDVPDSINESNQEGVVQVFRRQIELLTQRMAAMEAVTMAPPDYSSRTS